MDRSQIEAYVIGGRRPREESIADIHTRINRAQDIPREIKKEGIRNERNTEQTK